MHLIIPFLMSYPISKCIFYMENKPVIYQFL